MGGNQYWMALQDTFGRDTGTNNWNNTSPTTTVFSVSGELNPNESTKKIIAYVFAEVPGFSKFGSYTGNGSADGPFVYTGFKPRWIMIKRTDSANDWHIIDTARDLYNVNYNPLFPNLAQGESPDHAYDRDILSNGFKIRSDISYLNASGGTFIYAAFAESIMIPTIPETTTSTESGSANLEEVTVTPSNGEAIIDYTIPSNPAFDQVVILRSTQPIVDTPSNGASYNVNDVIGSATVACVDATIASSTFDYCTASSLSNNTTYYFKAYTKSGTIFTEATLDGSPSTPNVGASNITVSSYRLRNDDGNDTNASYLHSENTPATSSFISDCFFKIQTSTSLSAFSLFSSSILLLALAGYV